MVMLEDFAEFVTPPKAVRKIKDDPDDNRILECALESGAQLIISGDHHLLELKQYRNIKILSPSDFLREY